MAYGGTPIKDVPVENPEALMRKYKETGDQEIRNQLVMHYIQRVNIAIYNMRSILLSNIPFEDFFNQGVIALIDCIERYDPDRGASFDTYSYTVIRGAILKYLRKQNWLPNRVWDARKKIKKGRSELEQSLMREPTDAELAAHLGMSEKTLSGLMQEISVVDTFSFEELLEETYGNAVEKSSNILTDNVDTGVMDEEMRGVLAKAIDALPPKQKQVVSLYFYENLNMKEIGEVLDISLQRVSQIRKKALETLAEAMKRYESGD